jgi:HNH endonuclease
MEALGLSATVIASLNQTGRPPIPPETVHRLLIKSRGTCCFCHEVGKNITVHHLAHYADSKDHSEGNLIVLCLNCHGEAHTKRDLGKNLTADILLAMKQDWEQKVAEADSRALMRLFSVPGGHWDYFNHTRVLRLAHQLGVKPEACRYYANALAASRIASDGSPDISDSGREDDMWSYEHDGGQVLYAYMSDLIRAILNRIRVTDITNALDKSTLSALAQQGDFVFVQGAHYFKRGQKGSGKHQMRTAMRRFGDVRIRFVFDAWESTSCSSWDDRLSGRKVASVVGLVESSDLTDGVLTIRLSVLAIGSQFRNIVEPRFHPVSNELEDEEFEADDSEHDWELEEG